MIAPAILVAAKVMARSITDVRTVPKIPARKSGRMGHRQSRRYGLAGDSAKSDTARKPTAIPKVVHKNAGVTVITAVIVRTVATTPIIMLAIIARAPQLFLQEQEQLYIVIHLPFQHM